MHFVSSLTQTEMNMADEGGTNLTEVKIPVDFTATETSITAATLILIIFLTIVGNSTICFVIFRNKRMWTEMNLFLLNLALGDIALCLSMGFSLVTAIKREWTYGEDGPVCVFNGALTATLSCNTIFTHTLISIDRYFAVVMPMRKMMTKKKAALMILGGWILSLAIALAPVFGLGRIGYNGTTMQCGPAFPKTKLESLYVAILALLGFILPLGIMTCVYVKIYLVVRRHARRISTTMFGRAAKSAMEVQRKIVLTFFLVLVAFFVCWTPFFVFISVALATASRDEIPHGLGIAAFCCGYFNSACNPFIIGLRSDHFRDAFHKLLCWPILLCRRAFRPENKIDRSPESTRSTDTKHQIADYTQSNEALRAYVTFTTEENNQQDRNIIKNDGTVLPGKYEKRHRKSGAQVEEILKDALVFENFIHVIGNKVWSESAV